MTGASKNKHITGKLSHACLCRIEQTKIWFIYAYVVCHNSTMFKANDWFVSSYVVNIEKFEDHYLVKTANSINQIPSYEEIVIPESVVSIIRTGTAPMSAVKLLK